MYDFWMPQYKYQLVEWLSKYDQFHNWNRMKKKQLMAIYINIRKKGGRINEKISLVPPMFIQRIKSNNIFCQNTR